MGKPAWAGALGGLLEEILIWDILVRLPSSVAAPSAAPDRCGGRGSVEIPFGSELDVFFKLPHHLADAEPGARGNDDLRLSAVPGGALSGGFLSHQRTIIVKCFFLWVDALAKSVMKELQEEHEEWLPMLPRTTVATARALREEMEGEARNDRELDVKLRILKKKVRKLEDQAQIPICNYF
ncbi:hypothetical protein ZWY2020_026962 [Hordeum vulgare]|nr:hypothetical protein ZWY2020_026962 [Hordeum vulgare]